MTDFELIVAQTESVLDEVVRRSAGAHEIALDVEANGLYAYRAKLCALQLCWAEADRTVVAVVDPLTTTVAKLKPLLESSATLKVLHDLTFDARLLSDSGITLNTVYDTSVTARFLECPGTGLQALLSAELSVAHDKRFQQHNWAERPLTDAHLQYLAGDVANLLQLRDKLAEKARALDIESEVAAESDYKLKCALTVTENAPAYIRIKGARALDPLSVSVLRELALLRDLVAEERDVPPYQIMRNEALLTLARARSTERAAWVRLGVARAELLTSHPLAVVAGIERGVERGVVPETEQALLHRERPSNAVLEQRLRLETALTRFRRAESSVRGVSEQVVLPGHCLTALVNAALEGDATMESLLTRVPGIGQCRIDRYGAAIAEAVEQAMQEASDVKVRTGN